MKFDPFGFDFYIFDLDDTLYSEIDYLSKMYENMGELVHIETGLDSNNFTQKLIERFLTEGRTDLLNWAAASFELNEEYWIPKFLEVMRTSDAGELLLRQIPKRVLAVLSERGKNVLILTNGNVVQQKNKIKALTEIQHLVQFEKIYFANQFEPKPSRRSFDVMLSNNHADKGKGIMVGDSIVDERFAINSNLHFKHESEFFDLCVEYLD